MPTLDPIAKTPIEVRRENGKIWSHVRRKLLVESPEERVRQEYLCTLVNDYGYSLGQIKEEENVTGRGSAGARADFILWRTVTDKEDEKPPFIIVECKSDNVTITEKDYRQGENYARIVDAPFFVTHNSRETKYWRVRKDKLPGYTEEIANIPEADADDKRIKELIDQQKTFDDKDFARLLQDCHDVIRNRDHKDPAAFDEIAKILFMKVDQERRMRQGRSRRNLFTADFMREQQEITGEALVSLFRTVKNDYKTDKIFHADEEISLKFDTALEIVKKLEKYNLSDTSEDIKGIAFERFLGRTFRGEIGQFFTPRTIVEFMIRMVDPQEGEIICDPASGSGGFLIRFFEIVREKILADADRQQREAEARIDAEPLTDDEKAAQKLAAYEEIQKTLVQKNVGSRLWELANRCIYGTDANDRMARTSKMNMIMHGDGHGGVHHHNGLLNVNGIFEGRFQIILTNPPFGSSVEASDRIRDEDLEQSEETRSRYEALYRQLYKDAQARVRARKGESILTLFSLPKAGGSKMKTEILFIERCLDLLAPGGRLGIVLPEGIFNNPSLAYVREFCEDRAKLLAVVSLPQETFASSGASVKASLLFLRKFTDDEKTDFDATLVSATAEVTAQHQPEMDARAADFAQSLVQAKNSGDRDALKAAQTEKRLYDNLMVERIRRESRALLKERFDYPIFLYEAEKVGLTATGEADTNELYPNPATPKDCVKTCLELFRDFQRDPNAFLLPEAE